MDCIIISNMKIQIQEEWWLGGTCGCDPTYVWKTISVSPNELVELIRRCKTIKLLQNTDNEV